MDDSHGNEVLNVLCFKQAGFTKYRDYVIYYLVYWTWCGSQ